MWPGAAKRKKPKENSAKTGGGSAATTGKMEWEFDTTWSRRRQQSASAGFWAAIRSSVTEITGKRITISMASAANCVPLRVPFEGAWCSHWLTITVASNAQARLRVNSILSPDSTTAAFADKKCVINFTSLLSYLDGGRRFLRQEAKNFTRFFKVRIGKKRGLAMRFLDELYAESSRFPPAPGGPGREQGSARQV